MRIHLVNPSDISFGVGVVTPRWLYVLAAATPAEYGAPAVIDETLKQLDLSTVSSADVVGIGIHTGNAYRGYELGRAVRAKGAYVVFGGIHPTLYPDEAREHGAAHVVVRFFFGEVRARGASGEPGNAPSGLTETKWGDTPRGLWLRTWALGHLGTGQLKILSKTFKNNAKLLNIFKHSEILLKTFANF